MQETFVLRYETMGTAYGRPVDVYANAEAGGASWALEFHHTE